MSEAVMGPHRAIRASWPVPRRWLAGAMLGIVAAILGIVGIAVGGRHPSVPAYLAAVAAIVLGVLVASGSTLLDDAYMRLLSVAESDDAARGSAAGTTVDFFLGFAIVILGVLAILQVTTAVLLGWRSSCSAAASCWTAPPLCD